MDITFWTVIPPVRISITGNWMHTHTLEMLEVNNNGRIYASGDRVTVAIEANYQVARPEGHRTATVKCTATRVDTRTVLFTASAALDADKIVIGKGYKAHPDSRVTRAILPGSQPPPAGAEIVDVRYRATSDQARDLVPVIYKQLRDSCSNITERAKEAMKAAEGAK